MPSPVYLTAELPSKGKIPISVKKQTAVLTPPPVKPANVRGRPCLLTGELEAKLLSAIEDGLPLKQSAMLAGVCYETLNRWRKRGEIDGAPPEFRHLCQALHRSEAIAMQRLVSQVSKAGNTDWRAAAWILERRHPDDFARAEKVEHTGKGGKPLIAPIDCEVLRRIKKQEGIKEMLGKLGECLAEVQRKKREEGELELMKMQSGK